MNQERMVLCGASAYEQKYYLNEAFGRLPSRIQDELKIMCVLFTELLQALEMYYRVILKGEVSLYDTKAEDR